MADETIKIGSGKSKFSLPTGEVWEMDIASALRDCEKIRKQVNDTGGDNFDFLDLLVQLVQDAGGPMLSTGQADEFWDVLNEAYLSIKKTTREFRRKAEVAAFYGIDTSDWDERKLDGFEGNIKRLQAERTLQDIKYRSDVKLRAEAFYQLVLAKTEDEDLAQLATGEYMQALMRANEKVE